MNTIAKNILAVITGIVAGSIVNMGLIMVSGSIIPPPEGADITTMEGLQEAMHLFEPKHFLFPFLAHALGTFAGAFTAVIIADNHKLKFALAIGCLFLVGGIINVIVLPSPLWFTITDLAGAYIPMAYLAWMVAPKSLKSE